MNIQKIKIATIALCLTISASVFAQDGEQKQKIKMKDRIAKLDINNDSMLSKEELKGSKMEKRFINKWDTIDTTKDGLLSFEELKAYRKEHKGKKGKRDSRESKDDRG